MTSKTATAAQAIKDEAATLGVTLTATLRRDFNGVTREWDGKVISATVTAELAFTPGDMTAYLAAESACNHMLAAFPMTRPGSVWGTDSGSVGGHAGMTAGLCRMNKSGVAFRLAAQFAN